MVQALPGLGTLGAPELRGGNAPPVSRRYRAERPLPFRGKFRWNRGPFKFALSHAAWGFFHPRHRGWGDFSHEDGWCNAPPIFSFYSRIKRENGPCTVQKRKTRGRGFAGARKRCFRFQEGLLHAAWCERGFWWASNRLASLFAVALAGGCRETL